MNILLDTHAMLWFLSGDKRMSQNAREVIGGSNNRRFLSDASLWEVSIKRSLGKLQLSEPFESRLMMALKRNAIESLTIEKTHIFGVSALPFHHRDPFDRLLISTAIVEGIPVVTNDPSFRSYSVKVIW